MSRFLISILAMRMDSGIEKCLAAIRRSGCNYRLLLTSNGDPEVAAYMMKQWRQEGDIARVDANPKNLGFIAPNEAAFQYAAGEGYDYLVMVNDDCLVPAGWLEQIEATFARHPAAAIVGGSGVSRTLTSDFHGYLGRDLEYIECSAAAIRVSVIQKVAKTLFLPSMRFAYCEDAALSLEVQRRGYTIHQAPFTIEHSCGTTRKHVPEAAAAEDANRIVALSRYAHWLKHRTFAHRIVVKRRASIGDVLLTTPVIRKLWEENPLCEIVVETDCSDVFAGNPCVASAARDVGRMPTDRVVDLDGSYEATPARHIIRSYMQVASVECPTATEAHVSSRDREWAGVVLPPTARWVAVHAGLSTWHGKNYPIERWVSIVEHLTKCGYSCVLVGSQINNTIQKVAAVDLCGKTSIGRLFAVMERCVFAISIDSFPLHAAQAVGTPVVGLFGVTTPEFICTTGSKWIAVKSDRFHPETGLRHRLSGRTMVATTDGVMKTIAVDAVKAAVDEMGGFSNTAAYSSSVQGGAPTGKAPDRSRYSDQGDRVQARAST